MKRAFSLIEIGFVLFVLAAVFFAVVPFSVSNVKQARFISEWKNYIEQVSYSYETLTEYKKTNYLNNKDSIKRLMHYLDAKAEQKGNYKFKMMNGKFYQKLNTNKFDEMYKDNQGRLIGIEYGDCKNICATIWVDLNGYRKSNSVGKDIFVYEIYPDGVKPYGYGINVEKLKKDCSKSGTGMFCSEFYLIGGDLK